jgi:hypothetical protein
MKRMCSICKPILKDFKIIHKEEVCPLRNSRYCSYCSKYGHLTKNCPAKPLRKYIEPFYLEQLIPPRELKEFNITSLTPIPHPKPDEPQRLIEIKDNDQVIVAYLTARSIKITKGRNKKHILEDYAKTQNKKVVYIK